MSNSDDVGGAFIRLLIFLVIMIFICGRGCMAEPRDAVRTMEAHGFEDVKVKSHHYWFVSFRGCGADAAQFKMSAKNVKGKHVNLNICAGWPLKGTTIRGE